MPLRREGKNRTELANWIRQELQTNRADNPRVCLGRVNTQRFPRSCSERMLPQPWPVISSPLFHPQSALESLQGSGLHPERLNPKAWLHFPWIQSMEFMDLFLQPSMESQTLYVLREGKQELGAELGCGNWNAEPAAPHLCGEKSHLQTVNLNIDVPWGCLWPLLHRSGFHRNSQGIFRGGKAPGMRPSPSLWSCSGRGRGASRDRAAHGAQC